MTTVEFNNLVYTASRSLKYPALKFTHNQEDANDLIQETILKALNNKSKFKQGTNIRAWLYIIMKNTFISGYNKVESKRSIPDSLDGETVISVRPVADHDSSSGVVMGEIQEAIGKLERHFSEPFMMHFKGYKYEEIAEMLDLPLGTIKNRIHVARKMLSVSLKDYR